MSNVIPPIDGREAASAALGLRMVELRKQVADEIYHQLKGWVGRDASREVAAIALATWARRHAVDEQTSSRVLSWFEPEPKDEPGKDFLSSLEVVCARCDRPDPLMWHRWDCERAEECYAAWTAIGEQPEGWSPVKPPFSPPAVASVDADQAVKS